MEKFKFSVEVEAENREQAEEMMGWMGEMMEACGYEGLRKLRERSSKGMGAAFMRTFHRPGYKPKKTA